MPSFCVGFAGSFYFIRYLPCCYRFALFVGFAGYIFIWFVFHPASNICPLFAWALQTVFISNVICPAVLRPASNVCPLFMWPLRAILILYVTLFAVAGAICSRYYSPCFLTFAFFRGGCAGSFGFVCYLPCC